MTNNAEREAFEKWIQTTNGWKACKQRGKPMHLRQNMDGSYNDFRVNDRWFAWKARAQASGVPGVTWKNIGSLQRDSYATGRRLATAHVIGDDVCINVTDGDYEWTTRINLPWVKQSTSPASTHSHQHNAAEVTPELQGALDYLHVLVTSSHLQGWKKNREMWEIVRSAVLSTIASRDSKLLGELLAVIHRDGGQYQDEHGTEKAVEDAKAIFYEAQRAREDAERYRWLKNDPPLALAVRKKNPNPIHGDCEFTYIDGDILDQAIDAARKGEGHG